MNPHDRAVVIGIGRYADVAAGWLKNLDGPDNDAAAVAEWLRSPAGGGLPPDNVRVVRSADVPDPFPAGRVEPHQKMVIDALNEVARLPKTTYEGQYAGRRLYLYVSGHGWANRRNEAALVTAEAKQNEPVNVLVTSWIDWMNRAAPFQELVLWSDTCATRTPLTLLHPCELPDSFSMNSPSVRAFSGFASPVGLVAVEGQMPNGEWHGAFTYALLQGLKGAAATPVTSDSLRDYLRNAMQTFQRPDQRQRPTVAREPSFGWTDPMVFAAPERPRFSITLRFSQECVGKRVMVGVRPADPILDTVLPAPEWIVELEAGAYGVYVDDLGLSKAFQVIGGGADGVVTVP